MPELLIKEVSFRYPGADANALEAVSLEIRAGVLWLRGRNGAGKTTLMELISGLRRPNEGSITLDGEPVARDRVAYVPSTPAVFDELDAAEHGSLVEELWELEGSAAALFEERFAELLTRFAVPANRRVSELSAGMREKLGIALLLAIDVDVVLLDEPFTASDAPSLARGQQILAAMAEDRIVVITSHLPAVVEPLQPTILDLDQVAAR